MQVTVSTLLSACMKDTQALEDSFVQLKKEMISPHKRGVDTHALDVSLIGGLAGHMQEALGDTPAAPRLGQALDTLELNAILAECDAAADDMLELGHAVVLARQCRYQTFAGAEDGLRRYDSLTAASLAAATAVLHTLQSGILDIAGRWIVFGSWTATNTK